MSRYSFNCPSFGSGSDRLSCTPQNQCPSPNQGRLANNSHPPNYGMRYPDDSCSKMSKLASFAHYGGGNGQNFNQPAARSQNRTQAPQNKNPPPQPLKPRNCCAGKNIYVPPSFIENKPRNCSGNDGKGPAERLRNVDVLEELCYYVPGQDSASSSMDCYNVCNCCGASELVDCGCQQGEKQPPNPVKYSRRQRFTFQGPEPKSTEGPSPIWPFQGPCRESNKNSYDGPNTKASCDKILPPQTGIYYFDSKRRMFIPQKDMPKAPDVVYTNPVGSPSQQSQPQLQAQPQQVPCAPAPAGIEEYEILEEEQPEPEVVIQPIIQPIIMPNNCCCNPCNSRNSCNPCNPCNSNRNSSNSSNSCNGCSNPCNSFQNNMCNPNGMGMGACGPCIPMCIPMCPPQPTPQAPSPMYQYPPPMYPPPPPPPIYQPPMYPPPYFPQQMFPPQRLKKKKKKKKKEETIIEFQDVPYSPPASSYQSSPPPQPAPIPRAPPPKPAPISRAPPPKPAPISRPPPTNHSSGSSNPSGSSSYPSSGFSHNIVVAGGPAQLLQLVGGVTPAGAYSETLTSEILVTMQDEVQTVPGQEDIVITTVTLPPGEAENVTVNTSPSKTQFESNINILASLGSPNTGNQPRSPTTDNSTRNPSPRSIHTSANNSPGGNQPRSPTTDNSTRNPSPRSPLTSANNSPGGNQPRSPITDNSTRNPSPRSPLTSANNSPGGRTLSPKTVELTAEGVEVTTYEIPSGSDATILASNDNPEITMIPKFM